jgi:hypothetical protein
MDHKHDLHTWPDQNKWVAYFLSATSSAPQPSQAQPKRNTNQLVFVAPAIFFIFLLLQEIG